MSETCRITRIVNIKFYENFQRVFCFEKKIYSIPTFMKNY